MPVNKLRRNYCVIRNTTGNFCSNWPGTKYRRWIHIVNIGFPSQRASKAGLWCFSVDSLLNSQWPMIYDVQTLMSRIYNTMRWSHNKMITYDFFRLLCTLGFINALIEFNGKNPWMVGLTNSEQVKCGEFVTKYKSYIWHIIYDIHCWLKGW